MQTHVRRGLAKDKAEGNTFWRKRIERSWCFEYPTQLWRINFSLTTPDRCQNNIQKVLCISQKVSSRHCFSSKRNRVSIKPFGRFNGTAPSCPIGHSQPSYDISGDGTDRKLTLAAGSPARQLLPPFLDLLFTPPLSAIFIHIILTCGCQRSATTLLQLLCSRHHTSSAH